MRRRIDFDRGRGWRGCECQTLRTGASRFVFGSEVRRRQDYRAAHLRRVDRSLGARPRACARCAAAGRSDDYPARSRLAEDQRRPWRRYRARARALRAPGGLRRVPWSPTHAPSAARRTKCANHAPIWLTAGNSPARRTANRNGASGCITTPFAQGPRFNPNYRVLSEPGAHWVQFNRLVELTQFQIAPRSNLAVSRGSDRARQVANGVMRLTGAESSESSARRLPTYQRNRFAAARWYRQQASQLQ
jgi:hypothetical protein